MKGHEKTFWDDENFQNLGRYVGSINISTCNCAFDYM